MAVGLADTAEVRIYDNQSLVLTQILNDDCSQINVSNLNNGTYYLNILKNGDVVYSQTLIIKH